MVTFPPAARAMGRALLSGAAAFLLLLRVVAILSADASAAVGDAEPAVVCVASAGDGSQSPHPAPGDRHCAICLLGAPQRLLDAALATPDAFVGPEHDAKLRAALFSPRAGPASRACGWIGSWSSRAPPRV
ncbi:hypothetical protein [Methylosinus sp. Sm6]|uniref:hypothetical protein n=1 Tax=Methylosinus sp. Sm6 TaxID=2866948 RepID=UPI001C99DB51|nr:hypothetical protein [Methylosinus sp. Sm6]MBY6240325.1 hypothetical protein [Methylosinus sp. Sm6]